MSQRGIKREIEGVLLERDRLWELVKSYGNVAVDLRERHGDASSLAAAICDEVTPLVERIGHLNKKAEALAATLRTPKTSFSGRYLRLGMNG